MKNINKRTKVAISALMVLVLIAATWAYFTSESKIDNNFNTLGKYGMETIEKFTPERDIEPGVTIEKEVGVKNTGDGGLVVRVRLDEKWAREGTEFIAISSEDNGAFNGKIDSTVKDAQGKVTSTQVDKTDGAVAGDATVMHKNLLGISDGTWTKGNDGYYYYSTILAEKNTTSLLFDTITLAGDVDLGKYGTPVESYSTTAYTVIVPLQTAYDAALLAYEADKDNAGLKAALATAQSNLDTAYAWSTTKPADTKTITYQKVATAPDPSAAGYAKANYTLTVITQVCQATEEAVDETWPGMDSAVKTAWGLQ